MDAKQQEEIALVKGFLGFLTVDYRTLEPNKPDPPDVIATIIVEGQEQSIAVEVRKYYKDEGPHGSISQRRHSEEDRIAGLTREAMEADPSLQRLKVHVQWEDNSPARGVRPEEFARDLLRLARAHAPSVACAGPCGVTVSGDDLAQYVGLGGPALSVRLAAYPWPEVTFGNSAIVYLDQDSLLKAIKSKTASQSGASRCGVDQYWLLVCASPEVRSLESYVGFLNGATEKALRLPMFRCAAEDCACDRVYLWEKRHNWAFEFISQEAIRGEGSAGPC